MLVSNIVRHLESHHILNNFQHCFRQLNSCETQLIGFINDFAKDVQNGGQTYVIVMDFSRASFCWWCCRKILGWLFNCRKLYRIWKNGRKTGNGIQYCQIKCPKNQRRLEPFIFNYTLHGCCLEAVDTTKYLGVYLSKDLRWNNYMTNITNKEKKTLGFLKRNLKECSSYAKEKACKALARPTVEYSSSVWDCYTGKNIVQVEMVLRTAARWVLSRYNR